jgi:sugar lactone lactonase YvrE
MGETSAAGFSPSGGCIPGNPPGPPAANLHHRAGTISYVRAELVEASTAALAEGPVWDVAAGRLVWVDILAGQVHFCDAGGHTERTADVGSQIGAALPADGGSMLLAVRGGFALLDPAGTVTVLLDVLGDRDDLRFNDAKCDPRGRAFAGTMSYDESLPGRAALYRLDDGPVATPVRTGVSLSNGLGWSPDGTTMYHADTYAHQVTAYDYDVTTGELGAGRVFATVPADRGLPDGLCVDDRGGVWVALHDGGAVVRFGADGQPGPVLTVPVARVTSCAFGGPDGDLLYVTTAGGGGIYAARTGFRGDPPPLWQPVAGSAPSSP